VGQPIPNLSDGDGRQLPVAAEELHSFSFSSAFLGSVVAQGFGLAALGALIGITGALVLGRFLSGMLFGVALYDLATFVTIPALVTDLAVLACVVPARRATRVDTIEVLRAE
jgi:ABC-type antimicrobial peptide transport system permease subunit